MFSREPGRSAPVFFFAYRCGRQACSQSTRLRLEPVTDIHLAGLCAINGNPEVMRFIGAKAKTRAETAAMVKRVKARWARKG